MRTEILCARRQGPGSFRTLEKASPGSGQARAHFSLQPSLFIPSSLFLRLFFTMFTFLFPVVHKFTLLYAGLQSFRAISSSAKPPLPPAQRRHAQRAQSAPRRGFLFGARLTRNPIARAQRNPRTTSSGSLSGCCTRSSSLFSSATSCSTTCRSMARPVDSPLPPPGPPGVSAQA